MCFRKNRRIEQIHVRVGNVLDRDQSQQVILFVCDAERVDFMLHHVLPGCPHAHIAVHARFLPDINVADIGA